MGRRHTRSMRSVLLPCALVLLTVLAVAAPSAVQLPWFRATLAQAGLVRAEPGFVELSFTNPNAVGTFVSRSGVINLDFEVTNHLAAAADLRWSVTATTEGDRHENVLKKGTLTVSPGQRSTHRVASRIACGPRRIQVAVHLEPVQGQSFQGSTIHFWVTGEKAATTTICRVA